MNTDQQDGRLGPYLLLCLITLCIGFFTTINGQLQGPLKESILSETSGFTYTLTTLITFCFFLGFLINGRMGGAWVNKLGYKTTLLRSMGFLIAGLLCFALSADLVTRIADWELSFFGDSIPVTYFVFLLGSYLMGTSSAVGLAAINPYVTAYPLRGTQPVQRLNIACALNSVGTVIAPFFVTGVLFAGVALSEVKAEQIFTPMLCLAGAILLLLCFTARSEVPDIEGTRSQGEEKLERSVWSFSHLRWGVVAVFFYIGAEVSVGVNINLHAMQMLGEHTHMELFGMSLGIPALMATLYWAGLLVGRAGSGLLSRVSPRTLLTVGSLGAAIFVAAAMFSENLWVLVAVGLFHSVMWGGIFTLAVDGLGKYTSKASGAVVMGIFGGAVIPLSQGLLADTINWQWSWALILICELIVFCFARWGSRVKETA